MKKLIFIGALALLGACGDDAKVSVGSAAGGTTPATTESAAATDSTAAAAAVETVAVDTTASGSDDTITVDNISDMPPECVDIFTKFLKTIEPAVSEIDWKKATLAEMETLGDSFQTESDALDAEMASTGCDKYDLDATDEEGFKQIIAVAAAKAPGTVGFLEFINALAADPTASAGSVPSDCAGTIAAIEAYMQPGKTMKDLPLSDVTQLGRLVTALTATCSADEAAAFTSRDDFTAFISG